jgi:putative DNA primase/helicase
MSEPTDLRLKLRAAGFDPIPCIGKRPYGDGWQNQIDVTAHQIERWARVCPAARNAGILTRRTPTLDADILDPEAAETVEQYVHERYDEGGYVLPRIGRDPKRAYPFRTEEFFKKITVKFISPDGTDTQQEKLEFLADGQQFVAFGEHPDTHQPYRWHSAAPGDIKREDLPYAREAEAQALVDEIVKMLVERFGYRVAAKPQRPTNGVGADAQTDWLVDYADHDSLAAGR